MTMRTVDCTTTALLVMDYQNDVVELVPPDRRPALVSHVISPDAQRHPLTLLRHTARNKEKLAAALQVALPRYRDLVARVTFGPSPIPKSDGAQSLGASVAAQMHHLIFAGESAQRTVGSMDSLILAEPDR